MRVCVLFGLDVRPHSFVIKMQWGVSVCGGDWEGRIGYDWVVEMRLVG